MRLRLNGVYQIGNDTDVLVDLGLAEGTAKARLRVGLRRLARELETEGIREWA